MKGRAVFAISREARAVVVMHLHAEAAAALRHHLADAAHADDPDTFAGHLRADHE